MLLLGLPVGRSNELESSENQVRVHVDFTSKLVAPWQDVKWLVYNGTDFVRQRLAMR